MQERNFCLIQNMIQNTHKHCLDLDPLRTNTSGDDIIEGWSKVQLNTLTPKPLHADIGK